MRDYDRQQEGRKLSLRLVRGADGRLRSSVDEADGEAANTRLVELNNISTSVDVKGARSTGKVLDGPLPGRSHRVLIVAGVSMLALVALGFTGYKFYLHGRGADGKQASSSADVEPSSLAVSSGNSTPAAEQPRETPQFTTILPKGKDIASLGGWTRVSPVGSDPVFAFGDMIGSVGIQVNEQPLPSLFNKDTQGALALFAQGIHAGNKLVANGTTVYFGSSDSGRQSVVFAKAGLLVQIDSQAEVSAEDWSSYVTSME